VWNFWRRRPKNFDLPVSERSTAIEFDTVAMNGTISGTDSVGREYVLTSVDSNLSPKIDLH